MCGGVKFGKTYGLTNRDGTPPMEVPAATVNGQGGKSAGMLTQSQLKPSVITLKHGQLLKPL
jgi:hypothetical protein